ncbi:MAG TPA: chloride channel protein, partial [Anaeromyxobacteraceae bacterium]|nr:chloride channel protein [Anaeromyxobacteraceae bacterium]
MKWLDRIRERLAAGRIAALVASGTGPLELGIYSRTIVLAVVLGAVAGLVGAAFNACVDWGRTVLLVRLAGAHLLRASGETGGAYSGAHGVHWLLLVLPAAGALVAGLVTRLAPAAFGGGSEQAIATYHAGGAEIPRRLVPVKFVASVATLATGGAGGREGPSMQLGSAIGGLLGRWLPTTAAERRTLYVAGIGAGMSAVFQTPLGAAVLAAEVVYRDDFEADALVPSVLASVVSYAVSYTLLGTRPFFGAMPPHPFVVAHLPFYLVLAVLAAAAGAVLVWSIHRVRRLALGSGLPLWLTPALGGLALGALVVALEALGMDWLGQVSAESALLGGGYGVAQLALTGGHAPSIHVAVACLGLALLRVGAASLTIGSGGSAGDFAPSLSVGALVGAAFGHLAA